MCVGGRGGGGVEVNVTPHKLFLSFFQEVKTLAPDVFSSCLFILAQIFKQV